MKLSVPMVFIGMFYVFLCGAILVGLFQAREVVRQTYSTKQEAENWQQLTADLETHRGRPRTSMAAGKRAAVRPPIAILFSENFALVLTWSLLFSSILYWVGALLLVGAFRTPEEQKHGPR